MPIKADKNLRAYYNEIDPYAAQETVFYLDPPYHHDTRKSKADYAVEQDHDRHAALVETILGCQGAVVLSGYDHPVYQPLVDAGWKDA